MEHPIPAADLVLLGAGHAHLEVLRRFAHHPPPGLCLTVIARESCTIYTGMVAGLIRGERAAEEAQIDLARLAAAAGARLIVAEAEAIDLGQRCLEFSARPSIPFDLLSIDVGGRAASPVANAIPFGIPARPIGLLAGRMTELESSLGAGTRVAVIGGGAGGVELALALAVRLTGRSRITLVCRGGEPLEAAPEAVRGVVRGALTQAGVELACGVTAVAAADGRLALSDGSFLAADATIWATDIRGPEFLATSGLACDAAGCVMVSPALRSTSHDFVFAAGDCASVAGVERPKSGVWAVHAGAALEATLRRTVTGRARVRRWRLHDRVALTVLGLGDGRAVAWRGRWHVTGRSIARWKDRADRRWVARFAALRPLSLDFSDGNATIAAAPPRFHGADSVHGEAAMLPPAGQSLVQSATILRAPLDDPYLFGQIAASHALGGIAALGARPWTAQILATLPPGSARRNAADLGAIYSGAASILAAKGCMVSATQAAEAGESILAVALNGLAAPSGVWRLNALRAGDTLVLTKPLGTGLVLAGLRRGMTRAVWSEAAVAAMLRGHGASLPILRAAGAVAVTHVANAGLAGAAREMLQASGVAATVRLDALPVLPGTGELIALGIESSRAAANQKRPATRPDDAREALVTDPQIAGGLLAGITATRAGACVASLRAAGYDAAAIGTVTLGAPELLLV